MTNPKPNLILLLVIAPFLGTILQAVVSNSMGINFDKLMILSVLVNYGLAYYDMDRLKLTGEYSNKIGIPAIIPLYLYRRAKVLNQSYIYSVVWSILFILTLIISTDKIKEFAWLITFQS